MIRVLIRRIIGEAKLALLNERKKTLEELMANHTDGKTVATASDDKTVKIWSIDKAQTSDLIHFHIDQVQFKKYQNAPGFAPVIMSVSPLENLQQFFSTA